MITAKQARDIVKSLDYYTILDELINNAINRAANLGKNECIVILPNTYDDYVHPLCKDLLSKGYDLRLTYTNNADDKYKLHLNWGA